MLALKFYMKVMVHFNIVDGVSISVFQVLCTDIQVLTLVSNVAVQLLQMQPNDDSKFTDILRCTSLKQDDITKDQYMCSPLQNLLLYHPGNQEVN